MDWASTCEVWSKVWMRVLCLQVCTHVHTHLAVTLLGTFVARVRAAHHVLRVFVGPAVALRARTCIPAYTCVQKCAHARTQALRNRVGAIDVWVLVALF